MKNSPTQSASKRKTAYFLRTYEALKAAILGSLATSAVLLVGQSGFSLEGAGVLVASMGASAVLLFCVPEGRLSQPWPLLGGHIVSAMIGVTCALNIANPTFAAALAVGASIFAMQVLSCTHPPGGATALAAVVGGPATRALGYRYVLTPVLLNVGVMLIAAYVLHSPKRSYPHGAKNRRV